LKNGNDLRPAGSLLVTTLLYYSGPPGCFKRSKMAAELLACASLSRSGRWLTTELLTVVALKALLDAASEGTLGVGYAVAIVGTCLLKWMAFLSPF